MKGFILCIALFVHFSVEAQKHPSADSAILDVNQWTTVARPGIYQGPASILGPKDTVINTLYSWALWCGGLDENKQIYTTASTYRQYDDYDYDLGPVTNQGTAVSNPSRKAQWDEVYKVSDWQVNNHQISSPIDAVNRWPGNGDANHGEPAQLAGFIDTDNDGVYEPSSGEVPAMKGNQMLYSVCNDVVQQKYTGAQSMPLEIHTYTYAFNCEAGVLQNTFFIDYYLINKSKNDYDSFHVGMWSDFDLGFLMDDAIGSVANKAFFAYDYDNADELLSDSVPMISVYPVSQDLERFTYYGNDFSFIGNPVSHVEEHFYGYLSGTWKDGECIQKGGNGHPISGKSDCTQFMYDGNPFDKSSWNMKQEFPFGVDVRGVGSVNFGEFDAGDTIKITWAFSMHWKHNKEPERQYFNMIDEIDYVKNLYKDNGFNNLCRTPLTVNESESALQVAFYPNPSTGKFTIQNTGKANYDLYNAEGKLIRNIKVDRQASFRLEAKGIYLLRNSTTGACSKLVVH